MFATLSWLGVSYAFSLYAQSFGRFNHTYGTLGGAIALLLWMFLSSVAILLGAELNAELEHQTEVDTTVGPERPMGERRAFMADTLGQSAPERLSRRIVRS
jgi:membrane protein